MMFDHMVIDRIVPGGLIDADHQERHAVALHEGEQVLFRAVVEAVEPGQGTDQTAAGRILAVETEPVVYHCFGQGRNPLTGGK